MDMVPLFVMFHKFMNFTKKLINTEIVIFQTRVFKSGV